MKSKQASVEKAAMDREVNVTVKTKMLEEQSIYLANMRTKLQSTEKELNELKMIHKKREEVFNKVVDENRDLKNSMVSRVAGIYDLQ